MSIQLGLERVSGLAAKLGRYERGTVHVAGTNGKGSVTSIVASILHASGLSVGQFNSPHLVSVQDSILINREPVSSSVYDRAREVVITADERYGAGLSPFEVLTLTALQIFEAAKLDVVVIEVGMGGREDATNVIPDDCILVSVLTAVDLDHQKFLGDTVELIAEHKAGIARPGKPFILGAQRYRSVEVSARRVVEHVRARFVTSSPVRPVRESDYCFSPSQRPFAAPPGQLIPLGSTYARFPLHGVHQLDNLSLALTVISTLTTHALVPPGRVTTETIRAGIESVSWPGRLTFHTLPRPVGDPSFDPSVVLVDGAHNTASAETLASYISELVAHLKPGARLQITYVLALSHSPPKTPLDTLSPIFAPHRATSDVRVRIATLQFTPPDGMPWVACVPPAQVRDTVRELIHLGDDDVWVAPEDLAVDRQLQRALAWAEMGRAAEGEERLVVLTGSLYLVADFYRLPKVL